MATIKDQVSTFVRDEFARQLRETHSTSGDRIAEALARDNPDLWEKAKPELARLGVATLLSNVNEGKAPWRNRP